MANLKDIRDRIKSVKSIQKVTKAMKMVAAAKLKKAQELGAGIESGQVSINHHGLGLVDTPFGGVKDSGYGSEGGPEGLDAYMTTKLVSQTGL